MNRRHCLALPGALRRTIAAAVAIGLLPGASWAQIVADPSAPGQQRPTVLTAPNGVPLVNITTPSAAGVSRNTYRQFDVGTPGAILNNSRTNTPTQLGGIVQGNPWLATGSARVILNEVNSSNPSFLNGPIEVAGQRAEVIVANPAGIQVNGSTFINASGVTLTTGTPVFKGGSLDSYIVQRGSVGIFGAGLDTRDADYTAIFARATEVNAGLWANYLKLVNGANTVDAATQQPIGSATPIGEPPRFMLDVAHMGGMYANHIFLVGTEKGLGVNNEGVLSSAASNLELHADGRLINKGAFIAGGDVKVNVKGHLDNSTGHILAAGSMQLSAQGITNDRGELQAQGDARIDTRGGDLLNQGGRIGAQGALALQAAQVSNASTADAAASIGAGGELSVQASGLHNRSAVAADGSTVHATLWSDQGMGIHTSGALSNEGRLFANGSLSVTASDITNTGTLEAASLDLSASARLHNAANASLLASDAMALSATTLDNQGLINVAASTTGGGAGELVARVGTFNNRSGGAVFADHIAIEAHELNNRPDPGQATAPVIAARESLNLGVHTLNNEDGAFIYSDGDIRIGGAIDFYAQASGQAQVVNNLSADIEAMGDIALSARTLRNERRNVSVTQVAVIDQTAQLDMPSWWVNGKNEYGKAIEATSNHERQLYYLLDPASILSDQLIVTPGGNTVRRVEVALDPRDSIYHAASGAYAGTRGVRERVTTGAGTVVLYASVRQDGVANPDQVSDAPDPLAQPLAAVTEWQTNTLSYNSAYGRCSTDCTLLVVQPGYDDPSSDLLRRDQTNLVPTHAGMEVSRTAHHTAVEDRLNPGAGATASIRAGRTMRLDIGASLTNRYADIQAGDALDVVAPDGAVVNVGQTLKRTHQFHITSQTAGAGEFEWTKPEITEHLGQLGGRLHGGQNLAIDAQDLSNTDQGRSTGLAASDLDFVGVDLPSEDKPLVVGGGRLFTQAPASQGYLIETDPRFTDQRQWLGSDYLLGQLASDPNAIQKRLGDGFYEQKLIREQIAELTGRRFLDEFHNDEAQFLALMDAGIAYAQAVELKPGIALTAEQMAQLTTDLVWLVQREVVLPDGTTTTALVPQVYLRAVPDGELLPSGALIAGGNVVLDIQRDLLNAGGRIEGDVLVAQAGRDITNIGGLMQARSELLVSAGRNVTISSPTHTTRFSGEHVTQSRTELAGIGAIRVTGVTGDGPGAALSIQAGQDVVLQGASVSNAGLDGTITIEAGRDVQLQTVTVGNANSVVADARNYRHQRQSQELGSDIAALGDIHISAGRDVTARAAGVQALGDVSVQAGNDIRLQAARATSESDSSLYHQRSGPLSKKSNEEVQRAASDVALGTSVGGANVVMQAGRDIQVKGSEVNAQHLLLLDAGRDVVIASEENHASGAYFKETKRSGMSADAMSGISYGKNHQNVNQAFTAVTQSGSSVGGGDVHIQSGRDTVVRSSAVLADHDITILAGRDARIEAASDTLSTSADSHAKSTSLGIKPGASGRYTAFGNVKAEQNGATTSDAAVQSLLSANGGSLTLIAGTDSQYKGTGAGNVNTQGGTLLAQDAVTVSGNNVTLSTADSHSDSQFHAQTKTFTVGSQLSGVVGSAITGVGDMIEVARHSDNDRLKNAAALKAGYDAYKLAGVSGADIAATDAVAGTAANPGDPNAASFGISATVGSSKSRQDERYSSTQRAGTVIQAGQIDIQAREGDLSATGAKLQAQDISLDAAGDIHLQAARNTAELHSANSGGSAGVGVTFGVGEQSGISFQVSASRSNGHGNGSETIHDNTVVTGTHSVTIKSGGDTNLRGAQVAGDTVTADVGGNLNIQTLQDTSRYESEQKSAGVSLSVCVPPICYGNMVTGSMSMAKEKIDHDFQSANQQSGIAAGAGGFDIQVKGNTDLQGGAITSAAAQDKNHLSTASLSYSDLTNTQVTQADSESMSAGYGGGSVVATVALNTLSNVLGNETGERGLPEDKNETSTTLSVISPAKVTITGAGSDATDAKSEENAVTLNSRDASTANEALSNTLTLQQAQELKAQQDEARQNQIAANYVGAVITNAIGDVAQQQGWPDGSWQKTALHGMAGLIQAGVAGTDPTTALTAAMLNEQLTPVLAAYLQSQGIDPKSSEFKALMAAGSALLGTAFDAANVTVTATVNNYLKHADVERLEARLKACGESQVCRDKAFDEAYRTSVTNDIELLNCKTTGDCDQLKAEYRAGYAAIEGMLDKGIHPDDVSLILNMETNAQIIIRRGLDKMQCATSACREQANYLVGVGKGLAKVTPAGLVTGSGVMAYELTTALLNLGLTDTAVALAQGIAGLPTELQQRLASDDPQVRGEALVDSLAIGTVGTVVTAKLGQVGYTATMRRIEAQVAAAKEAETIAARMREVAIHTDDARFSQVAQEIVKAEQAGWKTGDGKTWWPPENGKVPGTEQIVELNVGQRLDRYGGTSKNSSFLAPMSTPIEQRALPDTTDLAIRDEYIVVKPFKVEESRSMPWFGQSGMGIQYETFNGAKMPIAELVKQGYLMKVMP